MKRKMIAILCLAALVLSLAACSEKENNTTTMTGMVVSVEGTTVTLRQFDMNNMGGNRNNGQGQRPSRGEDFQRPEGDFTMPEGGFNRPEGDFTIPEGGFTMPEGGFTMPEGGFNRPEGDFTMPEGGFTMPEGDFTMPEGGFNRPEGDFTMPEGENPGFGNFGGNQGETTTVDLKNAHISIQDGDIKAAGSMSDIKEGSFLTITLDSKGEATEVLVGSTFSFGGGRGQGGFNGTGFGGGKGNRGNNNKQANGSIEQAA